MRRIKVKIDSKEEMYIKGHHSRFTFSATYVDCDAVHPMRPSEEREETTAIVRIIGQPDPPVDSRLLVLKKYQLFRPPNDDFLGEDDDACLLVSRTNTVKTNNLGQFHIDFKFKDNHNTGVYLKFFWTCGDLEMVNESVKSLVFRVRSRKTEQKKEPLLSNMASQIKDTQVLNEMNERIFTERHYLMMNRIEDLESRVKSYMREENKKQDERNDEKMAILLRHIEMLVNRNQHQQITGDGNSNNNNNDNDNDNNKETE